MNATPILEGPLVRLRPVREDDLPVILRWYTDPDVIHWLHQSEREPATLEDIGGRFGPDAPSERTVRWTIDTLDSRRIGLIRLESLDRDHGKCELAICIGEKDRWSAGYGTAAIRLVLAHAFETLGVRRVWLITDADNARGIRCYEKCGFRPEGTLRAHRLRYGEPIDMIIMAILREEWRSGVS